MKKILLTSLVLMFGLTLAACTNEEEKILEETELTYEDFDFDSVDLGEEDKTLDYEFKIEHEDIACPECGTQYYYKVTFYEYDRHGKVTNSFYIDSFCIVNRANPTDRSCPNFYQRRIDLYESGADKDPYFYSAARKAEWLRQHTEERSKIDKEWKAKQKEKEQGETK